jgi:hypothetical protein
VVVSTSQRFCCLGEQRGQDDSPDSRQGSKDLDVVRLAFLFAVRLMIRRHSELLDEGIELAPTVSQLAVDHLEPIGDEADVRRGCRDGSRSHDDGLLAEDLDDFCGHETADPVPLEDRRDHSSRNFAGVFRRGNPPPEIEEPALADIVRENKALRVVAPQLLAEPVRQPRPLLLELVVHAGPLPELDDEWVLDAEPAEAVRIGSQRVGEDAGIAAIVLGAGNREAVPKAVELLRVEREDLATALEKGLDNGAVRNFDGHPDLSKLAARQLLEPENEIRQTVARVGERPLLEDRACRTQGADLVLLGSPVDAHHQPGIKIVHSYTSFLDLDLIAPEAAIRSSPVLALTGVAAGGADSPPGLDRGQPSRGTGPPQALAGAGGIGCSRWAYRVALSLPDSGGRGDSGKGTGGGCGFRGQTFS